MKLNKKLLCLTLGLLLLLLAGCIPVDRYVKPTPKPTFEPTPTPTQEEVAETPAPTDNNGNGGQTEPEEDPDGLKATGEGATYHYPGAAPGKIELRVFKSQKLLKLYADNKEFASFPCAVGSVAGHKTKDGDKKTPEGEYKIISSTPSDKFTQVLTINYPNSADAKKGYESSVITKAVYESITSKLNKGDAPPMNTKLGGNISIVGKLTNQKDTSGSIRIADANIKIVTKWCKKDTLVNILP